MYIVHCTLNRAHVNGSLCRHHMYKLNQNFINFVFSSFRSMHNISISGELPNPRRRCASEGKRGKGKPRPVSAVLYPTSRGRSDTEPSSASSPYRPGSSSSTRNLSSSESPKVKQSSVLNRLVPRRKSKDGKEDMIYCGYCIHVHTWSVVISLAS